MLINNKIESTKNYGCLMLGTNFKNWNDCLKLVPDDMVYDDEKKKFGKETKPHITILFGFDIPTTDKNKLKDLILNETNNKPIELKIVGLSYFETPKFDVLKFDIESEDLIKLNKVCTDNFDYSSDFPNYHPHMTISYVKKGLMDDKFKYKFEKPFILNSDKFLYSSKSNDEKNNFTF